MNISFSTRWKITLAAIVLLAVVLAVAYQGMEYYTSTPSFCGTSCHTMEEQWEAWKSSKHHGENNAEGRQAGCIECHCLPGEKRTSLRLIAAVVVAAGAMAAVVYLVPTV